MPPGLAPRRLWHLADKPTRERVGFQRAKQQIDDREIVVLSGEKMVLPNAEKATTTIIRTREYGACYKQALGSGTVVNLKDSTPGRHGLTHPGTVERVAEARLPTDFGEFRIIGYRSL